jgi:hypothetical protein
MLLEVSDRTKSHQIQVERRPQDLWKESRVWRLLRDDWRTVDVDSGLARARVGLVSGSASAARLDDGLPLEGPRLLTQLKRSQKPASARACRMAGAVS